MLKTEQFSGLCAYTLSDGDMEVTVIPYGATVTHLRRCGEELTGYYDTLDGYKNGHTFLNAIVGRYANRIRGGHVNINGQDIQLVCNERGNQLHGGPDSFDRRIWDVAEADGEHVKFTLHSPDGDNGYPGNLDAALTYTLKGNTLRLDFEGDCDQDTIFAPTTHMYFHLNERCLDTRLQLPCREYLKVDDMLLPTERARAEGAFDFTELKKVGQDFDHCFIPEGETTALLVGEKTAIAFRTDYPAWQLYTGTFMMPDFPNNYQLALEPEFFPDSPNHEDYASPVLRKGEHYHRFSEYRFFASEEV